MDRGWANTSKATGRGWALTPCHSKVLSRVHSRLTLAWLFPWSLSWCNYLWSSSGCWVVGLDLCLPSRILCKFGRLDKERPVRLVEFWCKILLCRQRNDPCFIFRNCYFALLREVFKYWQRWGQRVSLARTTCVQLLYSRDYMSPRENRSDEISPSSLHSLLTQHSSNRWTSLWTRKQAY